LHRRRRDRRRLLLAVLPRFENGRITRLHAIAAPDDLARLEMALLADADGPASHDGWEV
jgi:hypothetical protein